MSLGVNFGSGGNVEERARRILQHSEFYITALLKTIPLP